MDRISELEARIAADTAELERLKAEHDYERYIPMLNEFRGWKTSHIHGADAADIRALLAARNHDPDVVALVRWAREQSQSTMLLRSYRAGVLAPFAAIKDE